MLDNVATVPVLQGVSRREARMRATELLERVGLDPAVASRYPSQLSGGQQQRVGVARALAGDAPVLLMDEPFSAVDPVVRADLQVELLRLQSELGKTIVFVTHDIDEAIRLGDAVAVLRVGGHLAQFDRPAELLAHPVDEFVASFVGRDRGYRRLGFVGAGELVLTEVPTTSSAVGGGPGSTPGWRVVVDDDGRPTGWRPADGGRGGGSRDPAHGPGGRRRGRQRHDDEGRRIAAQRPRRGAQLPGRGRAGRRRTGSPPRRRRRRGRAGAGRRGAGTGRCGVRRCGVRRCGVGRCGAGRCGAGRCGGGRCGAGRCGGGRGPVRLFGEDVLALAGQHVVLAVVPVLLGLALALVLGWWATRWRPARRVLLPLSGVLYTVPSLALFVVMPIILGTQILDPLNVVVALTVYALALLLRTVVDALDSVDPTVTTAATALGYRPLGLLLGVQLPLAVPVLVAGVRVASVSSFSLVAVAALIGQGALGTLFTSGFQRDYTAMILVGGLLIVGLAFAADAGWQLVGRLLAPWSRRSAGAGSDPAGA